jgi:hypothetical protein
MIKSQIITPENRIKGKNIYLFLQTKNREKRKIIKGMSKYFSFRLYPNLEK